MTASEAGDDTLLGVWRLVSAQIRFEDTGEVADVHGPDPQGVAVFTEGRMTVLFTASGRRPPTNEAETAALFRNMSAYTGRFTRQGDRIVTEVEVAWHPAWDGSRQPRFLRLEGSRLTLSTEVQGHPSYPGRPFRGTVVWTRDR